MPHDRSCFRPEEDLAEADMIKIYSFITLFYPKAGYYFQNPNILYSD
jgi:hypothetical protein